MDLVKLGTPNKATYPIHLKQSNVTLTRKGLKSGYQIVTRIHLHGGCNIRGSSILKLGDFVYIAVYDLQQVKLFQYAVQENTVGVWEPGNL